MDMRLTERNLCAEIHRVTISYIICLIWSICAFGGLFFYSEPLIAAESGKKLEIEFPYDAHDAVQICAETLEHESYVRDYLALIHPEKELRILSPRYKHESAEKTVIFFLQENFQENDVRELCQFASDEDIRFFVEIARPGYIREKTRSAKAVAATISRVTGRSSDKFPFGDFCLSFNNISDVQNPGNNGKSRFSGKISTSAIIYLHDYRCGFNLRNIVRYSPINKFFDKVYKVRMYEFYKSSQTGPTRP